MLSGGKRKSLTVTIGELEDKETIKTAKKDKDKRNQQERKELKWFDKHSPQAFIEWQPIEHPDFPGRRAEVGAEAIDQGSESPAVLVDERVVEHVVLALLPEHATELPRDVVARQVGERRADERERALVHALPQGIPRVPIDRQAGPTAG